jgi:hypothetical protein
VKGGYAGPVTVPVTQSDVELDAVRESPYPDPGRTDERRLIDRVVPARNVTPSAKSSR